MGSLFFVIFISDLPEVVMPGNCVSLYADDCKTSRPIHSDLHLNNNILELRSGFRDLGLVTVCNLSWNTHSDKISNKDSKILGLIKRTCKGFQDVSTLRTLYLALVRSQLESCSVVWSPHTARNISNLERIQRRATKFILKTNDDYGQ